MLSSRARHDAPPLARRPPAARRRRWRPSTPAWCAASSAAKRNACGVCARNRPSRGTVCDDDAVARRASACRRPAAPGWRPGASLQRRQQGRDGAGRDARAGGVVHQHDVGRVRRQRLQPGAHAVLAGGAAGARSAGASSPASAASIGAASPTGCSSVTGAGQRPAAWRITGLPARVRNCFGVSAPKRLPVPAATRMAAMRMGAHCRAARRRQSRRVKLVTQNCVTTAWRIAVAHHQYGIHHRCNAEFPGLVMPLRARVLGQFVGYWVSLPDTGPVCPGPGLAAGRRVSLPGAGSV